MSYNLRNELSSMGTYIAWPPAAQTNSARGAILSVIVEAEAECRD